MALQAFIDQHVPGPPRDYVGYGRHIPKVRWPNNARVAINIVLNYEEGSEYTHPAGDQKNDGLTEIPYVMESTYRDLAAESVYEYGSRAGVWRVQRLIDGYKLPLTCFAAATALERNREVADWLREAGHEPCSHGWRWEEVWRLSRAEEYQHILWALASFEETVGQRPQGWYCRYGPSVHTRELLVEEGGFIYDADAYNDDLPYFTTVQGKRHLVVPYSLTYNDARFVLAQGYGSPSDFSDSLKRAFDIYWEEGAERPRMMSIGLHPRLIGQAARLSGLKDFLDYALGKGDVWFAKRIDIANWWLAHHEEFKP
jgi:peptidoglycan/xylan/chitin deacetylase (PgdA/CDA1 family)